ncbi:unnamed protein product, partial [Polarella glacialis]
VKIPPAGPDLGTLRKLLHESYERSPMQVQKRKDEALEKKRHTIAEAEARKLSMAASFGGVFQPQATKGADEKQSRPHTKDSKRPDLTRASTSAPSLTRASVSAGGRK